MQTYLVLCQNALLCLIQILKAFKFLSQQMVTSLPSILIEAAKWRIVLVNAIKMRPFD